jgi:hypothetical protein
MYYELRDGSGNLYEGGLFDPENDYSINPYMRNTGVQLNNPNVRFTCDSDIAVMFGLVPLGGGRTPYLYAAFGTISNWSPSLAFQPQETLTEPDAAWFFSNMSSGANINSPGTDPSGAPTACTQCSITKLTTIADNNDNWDGSQFGIDPITGGNAVHWEEVLFGDWSNGCNQSLCTFQYSLDSSLWYAGEENYPTVYAANADFNSNGYVFESWDGVMDTDSGGGARGPEGAFQLPAPTGCASDAYGYCVYATAGGLTYGVVGYCPGQRGNHALYGYSGSEEYVIETPSQLLASSSVTYTFTGNGFVCSDVATWTPGEPKSVYGDPNLP